MKLTNIALSIIAVSVIGGTGYMLTHKKEPELVKAGQAKTAKLRVFSDTYMPMAAAQPITSQSQGYEEQILNIVKSCLATKMGFDSIEYDVVQSGDTAANVAALNNKTADLIIGGWSAKAERFVDVDFTNPYYYDNVSLASNDGTSATIEDVLKAGKQIAVQQNTNGQEIALKVAKAIGADTKLIKGYADISKLEANFNNRNDGYALVDNSYADAHFANAKLAKDKDVTHVPGVENKGHPTAMFTRKGSKLTGYINECMREKAVGELSFVPSQYKSMKDVNWANYFK